MAAAKRGRPRAEPSEQQRVRIIASARAAFARDGYEAVTVSGIAADAGVARAVVYEVVGGKQQLLGAVGDQIADELIERIGNRLAIPENVDRPLGDVVRNDLAWTVEVLMAEPALATILALHSSLDAGPGEDPVLRARQRLEDGITTLHQRRVRALGLERDTSIRLQSAMVLAAVERASMLAASLQLDPSAVSIVIAEFIAGGYLRAESSGAVQELEDQLRSLETRTHQ